MGQGGLLWPLGLGTFYPHDSILIFPGLISMEAVRKLYGINLLRAFVGERGSLPDLFPLQ